MKLTFLPLASLLPCYRAYTSYLFPHIYVCSGFCYFQREKKKIQKKSLFSIPKTNCWKKAFIWRVCNFFGGRKFTFLIIRLCKTSHFASFYFYSIYNYSFLIWCCLIKLQNWNWKMIMMCVGLFIGNLSSNLALSRVDEIYQIYQK